MWVAPQAESDPAAINMTADVVGADADRLLGLYLPEVGPGGVGCGMGLLFFGGPALLGWPRANSVQLRGVSVMPGD